jgi:hypothetical protein
MNLIEISNKFPTELDAIKYFEKYRWHGKTTYSLSTSNNINNRKVDDMFETLVKFSMLNA